MTLLGSNGDIDGIRKLLNKLDLSLGVCVHIFDAVEEAARYPHIPQFEQQRIPTHRVKRLFVVHKTGKETFPLFGDIFVNQRLNREEVIAALSSRSESQLVGIVRTTG